MAPCKLLCALIVIMCAVDATYTVRAASAAAPTVLSNTQLPVDTRGKELLTGEGDALWHPTDGHWCASHSARVRVCGGVNAHHSHACLCCCC